MFGVCASTCSLFRTASRSITPDTTDRFSLSPVKSISGDTGDKGLYEGIGPTSASPSASRPLFDVALRNESGFSCAGVVDGSKSRITSLSPTLVAVDIAFTEAPVRLSILTEHADVCSAEVDGQPIGCTRLMLILHFHVCAR